jgi:hypothetical protein
VAEQHDRDEGRQLPPDLDLEEPERARPARQEGDDDRERDERHHARLPVAQLSDGPSNEDEAAVQEDRRPQDGRDELDAGDHRQLVAEPARHIVAEEDRRDRQGEAQPELVAEHRDRVTGVLVVGGVSGGVWVPRGVSDGVCMARGMSGGVCIARVARGVVAGRGVAG